MQLREIRVEKPHWGNLFKDGFLGPYFVTTVNIDETKKLHYHTRPFNFVQVLENGNYEVGIHIADVSHYVIPGTILDDEAYERATSVYLVDRVVPMLPEILSNNACSLRPNEEKYTFSAVFELDKSSGKVKKQWIIH